MARDLVQVLDVSSYEFGSAMVIVQHSQSTIHDGVVEMAGPNVEGEDGVDEGEEQLIQHLSESRSDSLAVVEELSMSMVAVVLFLYRWKVGLKQLLALSWSELLARLHILIRSKARKLALAGHWRLFWRS